MLPKFDYYAPHSLDEAIHWLAEHKEKGARILAGGTDLLVDIRTKVIPEGHRPRCQMHRTGAWHARHVEVEKPSIVMALSRIPELKGIHFNGQSIRIGAMTTLAELEMSDVVRGHLTGLWDGAYQLGSPLVRNRGTYGGNLCNARPAADTAIPTLALNGKMVLKSVRGERVVNYNDFVTGPGKTIMEKDEILTEIVFELISPLLSNSEIMQCPSSTSPAAEQIQPSFPPAKQIQPFPPPAKQGGVGGGYPSTSSYIKLANRKSLEIGVVGAAAAVWFENIEYRIPPHGVQNTSSSPPAMQGGVGGGKILYARISLGAVAPKPLLVPDAGDSLIGRELTRETITEAARIASEFAKPISDHRGSKEYRKIMVEVLTRRALNRCLKRLSGVEVMT